MEGSLDMWDTLIVLDKREWIGVVLEILLHQEGPQILGTRLISVSKGEFRRSLKLNLACLSEIFCIAVIVVLHVESGGTHLTEVTEILEEHEDVRVNCLVEVSEDSIGCSLFPVGLDLVWIEGKWHALACFIMLRFVFRNLAQRALNLVLFI